MKSYWSVVLVVMCLIGGEAVGGPLERLTLSADKSAFVTATTHRPFYPWGFNYDRDFRMRLLEDYWVDEWATVVTHFAEMKRRGANVVRVHLQFARFMDGPDRPNAAALGRLGKLIELAQADGLYLDITGLACYRRADVPDWYTKLDEDARWAAQAKFWEAVAGVGAGHPAVFCYDLVNEPSVPAEPRNDWLAGDLAGFTYCQVITLDPKGRDRTKLAVEWVEKMTAAIRKNDRETLITVGLLPFPQGTGFDAAELAKHLDFIAVHYYPKKGKLDEQVQFLKRFSTDRPLVVEEIFPLGCSVGELAAFMKQCPFVTGWVGFYWGHRPADLEQPKDSMTTMVKAWLGFFEIGDPHKELTTAKPARP